MSIKLDKYMPLYTYLSPASIPQIVAHIQDYLVNHPILSVETIAEIIVQSLQEHPELINGEAIPISAESEQSIKAYIDALPALDTYTKAEINALLLGKQDTLTFDQAPTPGSSNPVTSSGIIAAMSALQSALETQISAKADRASTYTKTQVDTLLEDKADADDVYSKNTMDAKLLEINTDIDNLEDALGDQSQQIDDLGPYNGLDSESTIAALSAAQGMALNNKITWKTLFYNESGIVDHSLPPVFAELEILVISNRRQLTKRITYDALANMYTQVAQYVELMMTDFIVNSNGLPEWGAVANVQIDKTTNTCRVTFYKVFQGSSTPIDSLSTSTISIYYR